MRWLALLLAVAACDVSTGDPSQDPSDPGPGGGEIDGEYLDVQRGACFGGVGGTIRCSGSPCETLDEATCAANAACSVTYTVDDANARTFRGCFPIDARSTAAGDCTTLGAADCATRSDCSPSYRGVSIFSSFVACNVAI
jgi:hypothetical protein